jgi:hypothetical protein
MPEPSDPCSNITVARTNAQLSMTNLDDNDLFAQKLYYDTKVSGGIGYKNGNISSQAWMHKWNEL